MEDKKILKIEEKEEENEAKKAIEIEDYCYRIVEMRDSINDSISNILETINKQKRLIELIKKGIEKNVVEMGENEKKYFSHFCDDVDKSCEDYLQQSDSLILKRNLLNELLNRCNNNKSNSQLISILCEAFGIFKY